MSCTGMIDYKEFYDRFWLAAADDENLTERGRYLLREEEEDEEDEAAAITIYEASTSAQSVMYNEEESNDLQITTREAREGVLLNNNRFSFARSAWLTQLDRNEPTNVPDQLLTNIQPSERDTTKATKQRVNLSKVVPLGDLKVKHAGVWPPLMEQGFWPSKEEYNLSDHGLVHCLFTANVTYV